MGSSLFVVDASGNIATVDTTTLAVHVIGNSGAVLTDIGFAPNGQLYGVSFNTLYSINSGTGLATIIGSLGVGGVNALTFDQTGQAYAYSGTTDHLYKLNLTTGQATQLPAASGYYSAGDLTFYQGNLLLSTTDGHLVTLNPSTGAVVQTVSDDLPGILGLAATDPAHLYGFDGTAMYSLDAGTGASTIVDQLASAGLGSIYGATFDGYFEPPLGGTTPVAIVTLGGGAQTYSASAGAIVQAGSGSDTISATAGNVSVLGSSGQLVFNGGAGSSSVFGGAGSATLFGGAGGGQFIGGVRGHNVLVSQGVAGASTTLTGALAGDQLFGSASGNDVLNAGQGRESILGGGGNTTINGGNAPDVVFTGSGSTIVNGGTASGDTIVGGSGSLNVVAQNGDAVFGNGGAVNVSGSASGADSIIGGAGALAVTGKGGNMLVVAGSNTSNVSTGNGASLVFAGSGNLSLTGGAGSMQVLAASGSSSIVEGGGALTLQVVNGAAGGTDQVTGFRPGTDVVQLYNYQASQQQVTTASGSTLISLSDGTRITLVGVTDPGSSIIG